MKLKEISELLLLKEWAREELARRLGVSRNTIDRWYSSKEDQRRYPSIIHVEKMRAWLEEARSEARKQPA